MLVVYGVFAAYAFGLLMNLSGWPFVLGILVPGHADWRSSPATRWTTCAGSGCTRC